VTGEKLGAADVKELMERRVSPKEILGAVPLEVEMRSVKEGVAQKKAAGSHQHNKNHVMQIQTI